MLAAFIACIKEGSSASSKEPSPAFAIGQTSVDDTTADKIGQDLAIMEAASFAGLRWNSLYLLIY